MATTRRQMNWTGVGATPSGGSAVSITGVTSVSFDDGGSLAKFAGDGDRYFTTVVNDFNEPTCSITAADAAALRSIGAIGTVCAVTATHNDAKSLAVTGSGAITYALANAVLATRTIGGSHRQFGSGTVTFEAYSSDGVTNPLTSTVL